MGEDREITDRQLDILQFLELVGSSEECDVALCLELRRYELLLVPPDFSDLPAEYIARRELERLREADLVAHDGIVWSITAAGRKSLRL